jgi:hypothetical protein
MDSVGPYKTVEPRLWATYMGYLVAFGGWESDRVTAEWPATLDVGTDPRGVDLAMMTAMEADDPAVYPGGPSDAWMDAARPRWRRGSPRYCPATA